MSLLRRAITFALAGVMAVGHPAELLAASYVFRQPSAAGTYPVPVITNNVVNSNTYYKVDGRTYSISWQGSGGRSPYRIEMVGAPLPPGCAAPVQTGSILSTNCTFNQEGSYGGVVAQLTDANGMVVRDNAPTIVVSAPAPTLSNYSFPFTGSVGIAYAGTLRVNGGRAPFQPSRASGALPPGLALGMVQDAATGAWSVRLAGTPTATGSYTFDILVTDANQKQVTSSRINVSVGYGPVSLSLRPAAQTGLYRGLAGSPMPDAGVAIVGGTPPISLSLAAGTMPPGLSLGPDGALVGTPSTPGTYSGLQVRAVDSASTPRTATSAVFQVVVGAAMTAMLQGANDAYQRNRAIAPIATFATGGSSPYAYALTAGSLPPGVTLSTSSGQISGTPTQAGRYEGLAVTVTDAAGFTASTSTFAMVVADPLEIAGSAPRGVAGTPYAARFDASGGSTPYSFSLAQGDLPFGLELAEDGALSGTPLVAGTSSGLVVRVTDANGQIRDTAPFSIVVAEALAVASGPDANATRGKAYASAFAAAGGTAPYGFALVGGSLPPGLSLAADGRVTGTPSATGSYGPFTVRLTDAEGSSATGEASIVVADPLALAGSAGEGMLGEPYEARFSASGGSAPYAFDLAGGTLPPGLVLEADGRIAGTPTSAGSYPGIVLRVTDAAGRREQTSFAITVAGPLRIAGSPGAAATLGQSYSASFAASGGRAPYTFALAAGTLPPGLSLSPGGAISGTPTAVGRFADIAVRVTDAAGRSRSSEPFAITVSDVLAVAGTASTFATIGQPYEARFSASGGAGPYAWSLASGTLPPGLALDAASGAVAGAPTSLGTWPGLQLRATDRDGRSALSAVWGISVGSSLAIAGTPESFGTVGEPYGARYTASGGSGETLFALINGQLPAGLSLDTATGLISGTPSAPGLAPSLTVRVRDASGAAATAAPFDLRISAPLVVSGTPGPDALVGADYSGYASVSGGRSPYAWSLVEGTLPAGLTLSAATGVISGRPTTAGTAADLRLRVVDADGRSGRTERFPIVVTAPLTLSGTPGASATVGEPYAARYTASGGTSPYAFSLLGSALPAGLVLDPDTGLISGTPTAAAPAATSQVRVTDAAGRLVTGGAFGIDVREPLRLVLVDIGPASTGAAYGGAARPAGGRGPYVLALAEGALPPGLTLETDGRIGGTPSAAGSYGGIRVRATDVDGRTVLSAVFAIEVAAGMSVSGLPPRAATVGEAYAFRFGVSGGSAPYGFALAGGSLPAGLTLGPDGALAGTPTRAEAVSGLTAVARDRAGRTSSSAAFAIDVRDPVVVSGNPAGTAEVGRAYAAGFAAQGGRGPFVWSLASGSLPAGLRLDAATGAISGTPTTVQTASGLQLRAVDQDGRTATTDAFAIRVGTAFALSLASVLPGSLDTAFSGQAVASGGQGPYVYAITAGTLPAGLSFDGTTGRFAGTPSALSRTTLTVRGSDADGRTTQASTTISITDPLVLVLRASTAAATVGQAFSRSYAAAGGQAPYSYSLASGTLPPGLSLAAGTGTISGTPTTVGTYANLVLRVVDADGRGQTTEPFAIDVRPALVLAGGTGSGAPIQYGTVGVAYASGVSASGGRGPYTYLLSAGTLPAGLVLDGASGAITGTPTKLETATGLRITATDADGRSAPGPIFQIDVRDPFVLSYAPQTASTGSAYTTVPKTTGGRAGFVYTLAGGTLPAGLRLDGASGAITGTPTSSGTASGLSVRVVDADGRSATSTSFAITVLQPLTLTLAARHDVPTGSPFSVDPKADGGRQPYAWSATPSVPGTSFDAATGRLTGTLTASGTTRVTIAVTDADGRTLSGATDIVAAGAMTVRVPDTLMIRNTAYSGVFTADGGVAPYTVVRTRGALPPGIQLSGNGTLNGTPTVSGEYPITYNVIDKNGRTMSGEVTLIVAEPGLFAVNPGFVQHAWIGRYYEARGLRISNGTGPFTLLNSPQFPTGLTMTTAGDRLVISGIPTGPEGWFPKTQPTFFFKDGTGKYWGIKGYPIEILPELKDKWYDSNEGKAAAPNGYATLDVDRFSEPPMAMAKDGKTFARRATTAGRANQVKIEVDDGKFRFNTTTQRNYGFDNYGVTTVQTLSAPAGAVDFGQRISLSRDGQWLAVSAPNVNSTYQQNKPGGYVYVYRRTGEEFTLHSTSEVHDLPGLDMLVISDDGQLLVHDVRVSLNGTISRVAAIRRWTGSSWTTESTVPEATAGIPHLSADGSTLAFGGRNVRVYKKTGAGWSRIFSSPVSKIANGSDFSGPIAMNKTGSLIYHGGVVRFTGSDFIRTMYAYEWRDDGYILSNISTNSFWVGSSRPDYTMWMSGNDDLSQVAMTFGASSDFDVMYWDRPNDLASFSTGVQPGYGIGSGGKDVFMNDHGTLVLLRQSGLIAKRYFQ